jgi:pimeloyl-ACP methyl ester carboxylesterase
MPPTGAPPADVLRTWLDIRGGRVETWLLPATTDGAEPGPLLIFAHGNAESIDLWPGQFGELRRRGVSVMLVEYPGYGRSTGRPSQSSVTAAMVAAWDRARDRLGVAPDRIVAYGRSLGTGAACGLAGERLLAGLILESGFTSAADMAHGYLLPSMLLRDPFDNAAAVAAFDGPILLLHGRNDRIIPVRHAHGLRAAAPAAELYLMDCGHNDCPRPWDRVLEFLSAHGLLP